MRVFSKRFTYLVIFLVALDLIVAGVYWFGGFAGPSEQPVILSLPAFSKKHSCQAAAGSGIQPNCMVE